MVIQSRKVWIMGEFRPMQIEIENRSIKAIYPYGTRPVTEDYADHKVLPGFIDIHTHGAYGYDTNDGEPEGLRHWCEHIPEEGVTSFLPTTVTQHQDVLLHALQVTSDIMEEEYAGAEMLGIHFEGPFLDMEYKGAQPPEAIAEPSVELFQKYQEAAKGKIRYITLSPEHDMDFALTRYCAQHGTVVSMGHTGAAYETAVLAAANGAASMTHVFNGMTGLHHRKPGMAGAALRMADLYGEMICDGHHCDPAVMHIFFQAKGKNKGIMITDSLRAKYGTPGSHYQLGGHDIEITKEGLAKLAGTDTIAGSTLRMNEGLRILIEEAGVPVETAVAACTINPARVLCVDDRKGKICAGYDADLTVLDEQYQVLATYCRGKLFTK